MPTKKSLSKTRIYNSTKKSLSKTRRYNSTKKSLNQTKRSFIGTKIANHELKREDIHMNDLFVLSLKFNKEIEKLKKQIKEKKLEKLSIETKPALKSRIKRDLEYIDSIKEKHIFTTDKEGKIDFIEKKQELKLMLRRITDFFIDNYLEISREYRRKHSMKKTYIYEEPMFFEIVIFLILSKYMILYDIAIRKILSLAKTLHDLRMMILKEDNTLALPEYKKQLKEIKEKQQKIMDVLKEKREGESGMLTITLKHILDKIQSNKEMDQYFSNIYGNYLSKGRNNLSLLLSHISEKYNEGLNNNSSYSIDKSIVDIYEHVLSLGPKMNSLILTSINNRNYGNNTMTEDDISKYNSFEDFISKKKKEKKMDKKKYEDQEKKLAKIYSFLAPNKDFLKETKNSQSNTNNDNKVINDNTQKSINGNKNIYDTEKSKNTANSNENTA